MKIRALILIIALAMPILFAPAVSEGGVVLDRDTLIHEYGLPNEAELDAFIEEMQPTRETLEQVNVVQLYNMFSYNKKAARNSYRYLLDTTRTAQKEVNQTSEINLLLWFWNTDTQTNVSLYDYKNSIVYYGDYNILNDVTQANSKPLSEMEKQTLLYTIEQYDVLDWAENYPSTQNNSTTGWLYWKVAIEFSDGGCFTAEGSGSEGDNLPKTFSQLRSVLEIAQ